MRHRRVLIVLIAVVLGVGPSLAASAKLRVIVLTDIENERVNLRAEGSTDPDGDALSYEWIYYREPGTYAGSRPIAIDDANKIEANFTAPKMAKPETIHVVLAVTDQGTPRLTRYRRVIITVYP